MKSLLTICMFLFLAITAQSQTKTFVRIFDENGKKTHKGYIMNTSDSSLTINLYKETFKVPANLIAVIKLKRSFGHALAEGALSGLIVGGAQDVATGSIIAGIRNRPAFNIGRKQEEWIKVRDLLRQHYSIPGNQTVNTKMNQTH